MYSSPDIRHSSLVEADKKNRMQITDQKIQKSGGNRGNRDSDRFRFHFVSIKLSSSSMFVIREDLFIQVPAM